MVRVGGRGGEGEGKHMSELARAPPPHLRDQIDVGQLVGLLGQKVLELLVVPLTHQPQQLEHLREIGGDRRGDQGRGGGEIGRGRARSGGLVSPP